MAPDPNNSKNWALQAVTPFESHQQMMIQQQIIQHNNVEAELNNLRQQGAQAQQMIAQYEQRLHTMDGMLRSREQVIAEYVGNNVCTG